MDTKTFCTRTEKCIVDNPSHGNTLVIGLDLGYSAPKGFHRKGNFCFPNFCQELTGEQFGELAKSDIVYQDLETGVKYAVGDMATKSLKKGSVIAENDIFGRNHYLHPHFLVIARTALGFYLWDEDKTNGENMFIQTGLPPAYIDDEQYLRAALEKRHHFAVTIGRERKEFDFTLSSTQIDVMYQPMGTFFNLCFDRNGNPTSYMNEFFRTNILIVDGGFGTLDKFLIRGKQVESKTTDARLGMRRVLDETRKMIKKDLGVDISIPAMQSCLKSGKVTKIDRIALKSDEYDIAEYLEKANKIVCDEAFDSIKDDVFDVSYIIMAGGTGAAWYDTFAERLSGIDTVEVLLGNSGIGLPGIYTNARGYYMYRMNEFKKRR